ncbi:MAG: hypothetical protein HC851_12400 [Acaryochloris sp. RU_4_1]|nr:hypothetical protein [Acaryochloris sp. RU_4_1]NJR54996.1 hypothetical protein [Acaryochloris sp. CRU_2_0]
MTKLYQILKRALAQTAVFWQPIAQSFEWVHQAAKILQNETQLCGRSGRRQFQGLLGAMARWKPQAAPLVGAIDPFLKVTRSYWGGLFHCYDIENLPRTNNDSEQTFGKWRHHQRRCSGQKVAPETAVTRGSVQLTSALATQQKPFPASELATVPTDTMAAASFYTPTASTETGATAAIPSFSSDLLGSTGAEITPVNFAALGFFGVHA